jgi:hypothetical protein
MHRTMAMLLVLMAMLLASTRSRIFPGPQKRVARRVFLRACGCAGQLRNSTILHTGIFPHHIQKPFEPTDFQNIRTKWFTSLYTIFIYLVQILRPLLHIFVQRRDATCNISIRLRKHTLAIEAFACFHRATIDLCSLNKSHFMGLKQEGDVQA